MRTNDVFYSLAVLQMFLVLRLAVISFSSAKPCGRTAHPTTEARVARKRCLTGQASVAFLFEFFIALGEFHLTCSSNLHASLYVARLGCV